MIPTGVTWPDVAGALVLAIPSIIAAVVSLRNSMRLKTTNGKTVGEMVSEVHAKESSEAVPYATAGPVGPTS